MSNLLTDQIEFANIILLNKIDLVGESELRNLYDIIHKLNPEAKIIPTNHSKKKNIKEVVDTGLFDFEEAENSAGWIRELENEHVPETEEYGIGSFVFRSKNHFIQIDFLIMFKINSQQMLLEVRVCFGLALDLIKL